MTLHISNLSKRYGNIWILRDVSFDVEKGTVFGLIGPTASGKSTLLRVLAGQEKPSPPELTFGTEEHDVQFYERGSARKGFSLFGKKPNGGSSGLSSLDRALNSAQDILLLDDPLSGIDLDTRDKYFNRIKEIARDKKITVIYATSDFETAALIADNLAVLADGHIHQSGTAEELYESPISTTVARATGRCNIFASRRLTSTKFEIPEFQTIDGAHRLFAERCDVAKLGAINRNVSLAIRPESISMSFGASFPEDNLLKAVVTGVQFLGPVTVVALDADGLHLNAMVFRLVGLDVGQECMLGLPPERIKVLKD